MEIRELQVPAPWGHISIKAWGDSKNEPIICLHGLHDNAGTYDTLIPLLPQNFYYLCVDLPGHGFSSHFPSNLPLEFTSYIHAILIVKEHFKREKYALIGHSFGARVMLFFAQIFPEFVDRIVTLDTFYVIPTSAAEYFGSLKDASNRIKKLLSFKSNEEPSYSYDKIIEKIASSRIVGTLTSEAAKQLANRMIRKVGDDKYILTVDKRLRTIIYPSFSPQQIDEIFETYPITCPAISIHASNSMEMFDPLGDLHKLFYLPNFKHYYVEGDHHCHHTNPELVAPILTKFLLTRNNKL